MRPLVAFYALAFLITWGAGLVVALSTQSGLVNGVRGGGTLPIPFAVAILLLLVSGAGPALAAIIVSTAAGLGGARALLGQVLRWRAGLGWYALALLSPMLLTVLATVVWMLATGARPARWLPLPTAFQLLALPILPWGEEIGWRGFAQPRLQVRLAWLPASLIVGLMWGVWHQWPLLTPAGNGLDVFGLGVFFVYIVSESVLIGWVYNGGGRRLPLGWAGHAGLNAVGPNPAPFGMVALAFAGAALAVAMIGSSRGVIARDRPAV